MERLQIIAENALTLWSSPLCPSCIPSPIITLSQLDLGTGSPPYMDGYECRHSQLIVVPMQLINFGFPSQWHGRFVFNKYGAHELG